MAITDAYATVEDYRAVAGLTDVGDDPSITRTLMLASRHLDRELGRFFTKDASAVARTFAPPPAGRDASAGWEAPLFPTTYPLLAQPRLFDIDDLVSVTSVVIDTNVDDTFATTLTSADYELLPRNAALGSEPGPYRQLRLTEWGAQVTFPARARVRITGVWGWPAVPEAIRAATIEIARLWLLQTPRATQRVDEVGTSIATSRAAQSIVDKVPDRYRRVRMVF